MDVLFVVTKPDSKRKTFSVQLPILVGRSEEAKFRIQQDRVSRRHCEFFAQDGGVFLRDLGSTNGTFLNGQLVETSAKCPLESGAVVRVGSLEFRVEFTEVDAARRAPVAEPEPAGDRTVGVHPAPDTERLQDEHADADLPAVEAVSASPADSPEPAAGDMAFLTAERPATTDEAPLVEVVDSPDGGIPANEPTAPAGGDGFGFLGEPDASSSKGDDDQLGDFLKGLG